jgi:hypothetical protein
MARPATIRISEDAWLACLYKDEQKTIEDYVRNSRRLREVMGDHIVTLLEAGLSVVLDFPANTPASRPMVRPAGHVCGGIQRQDVAPGRLADERTNVLLRRLVVVRWRDVDP